MTEPHTPSSRALVPMTIAAGVAAVVLGWWITSDDARPPAPPPAAPVSVSAPPPAPAPSDVSHVARIEPAELNERLTEFTVVDVRDSDSYISGHIAGAKHIPLSRLEGEVAYLPRDRGLAFYCT